MYVSLLDILNIAGACDAAPRLEICQEGLYAKIRLQYCAKSFICVDLYGMYGTPPTVSTNKIGGRLINETIRPKCGTRIVFHWKTVCFTVVATHNQPTIGGVFNATDLSLVCVDVVITGIKRLQAVQGMKSMIFSAGNNYNVVPPIHLPRQYRSPITARVTSLL